MLLLHACQPDHDTPLPATASTSSLVVNKGDGRNPFSVAVMREALRNLRREKLAKTAKTSGGKSEVSTNELDQPDCSECNEPGGGGGSPVQPTHYYVRFKPADTDQLADLQELGFALSFEPLDENAAAGYQVPDSPDVPWLYTAVPASEPLPQHIQRERMEELYLFSEDDGDQQDVDPWQPTPPPTYPPCQEWDPQCHCYVRCSSISSVPDPTTTPAKKRNRQQEASAQLRAAGIEPAALYNEAMRITGHPEELIPVPGEITIQATRYHPSGTIQVQERIRDAASRNVPLVRVIVEARRWFKIGNAYTNNNGQFDIGAQFRQQAHIVVRFKNDQLTTRGASAAFRPWVSVLPIQHDLGMYSGTQMQGLSYLFTYQGDARSKGALSWTAATLFNSRAEMERYTTSFNIPAPPSVLNVFLSADITQAAATPMLRRIAETSLVSRTIDVILAGSGLPQLAIVKQVLQRQLPDITCRFGGENGGATRTTDDLNNTFYHELAHSIHYNQVGNNYWVAYINYIIQAANAVRSDPSRANATYGRKTDNGAERISISEGWAYYIGESFTVDKYTGVAPGIVIDSRDRLELQTPRNGSDDYRSWIVYGMYHDMTDMGEDPTTGVIDNVNAYTAPRIFSALQPDVITVRQFQNRVLQRNGYLQAPELEQLVTSYLY